MTENTKRMMDYLTKETKKIGISIYNQGVLDGINEVKKVIENTPDMTIDMVINTLDGFIKSNGSVVQEIPNELNTIDCKMNQDKTKITDLDDNPMIPVENSTYHDIISNSNYVYTNGEFIVSVESDNILNTKQIINNTTKPNTDSVELNYNDNTDVSDFVIPEDFL